MSTNARHLAFSRRTNALAATLPAELIAARRLMVTKGLSLREIGAHADMNSALVWHVLEGHQSNHQEAVIAAITALPEGRSRSTCARLNLPKEILSLRHQMMQLGISYQEAAKALGCHHVTIRRVLSGCPEVSGVQARLSAYLTKRLMAQALRPPHSALNTQH